MRRAGVGRWGWSLALGLILMIPQVGVVSLSFPGDVAADRSQFVDEILGDDLGDTLRPLWVADRPACDRARGPSMGHLLALALADPFSQDRSRSARRPTCPRASVGTSNRLSRLTC